MFRSESFKYCSALLICLLSATICSSVAQAADGTVRETVESFCQSEFEGAQDPALRSSLVHFSDSRLAEIRSLTGGMSPYVLEWQGAPLDVVDSFRIAEIRNDDTRGKAEVEYTVIARRERWGGQIHQVERSTIRSKLSLVREGERWRVLDPPIPKISKKFLSLSYRDLFQLPSAWYQGASRAQLLWLRNAIDTILVLESAEPN